MAIPSFIAAGSGATQTGAAGDFTTLAVTAPASILANDTLILHVAARATTTVATIATPTGFTLISSAGLGSTMAHAWFYRVCDGSESSASYNVDGTYTGTTPRIIGRIYQFRNAARSSPIDSGGGNSTATSGSVSYTTVSGSGLDRRGICLVAWNTTGTLGAFTGATGGTWIENVAEYAATNMSCQIQTVPLPTLSSVSGGSAGLSGGSALWRTITFPLIPFVPSNIPGTYRASRQAVKRASFY